MFNRREILGLGIAGIAGLAVNQVSGKETVAEKKGPQYAAFIKFIQELSYDDLAEKIAAMGFQGVEATIRNKGYITPEKAQDELPKFVEALNKKNLKILVMTSDMNNVNDKLNVKLLETAAKLGIKQYRTGYYHYDVNPGHTPCLKQLDQLKPIVKDLAALNHELGIQGVYQNHAGTKYVGGTLWDLQYLLEGIPVNDLGVAYDIRHAVANGPDTWPITWDVMKPHLATVYVKDCKWIDNKLENTPLGKGLVSNKFFSQLKQSQYQGTISLHVEYLEKSGTKENLDGLIKDFDVLKKWMA